MEKELRILAGTNLEKAVEMLQEAKERGEHVYCVFNGTELHSDNVTMDSAFLAVKGKTKEESDRIIEEGLKRYQKEQEELKEREAGYVQKVEEAKTGDSTITKEKVINGLKFIAENQNISHDELVDGLINLGCTFSLDDVKNQFPEDALNEPDMRAGDLSIGATMIVNSRDSEFGRDMVSDYYLSSDDDRSIYHIVRELSEDDSYTKQSVEKSKSL